MCKSFKRFADKIHTHISHINKANLSKLMVAV